MALWKVFSTTRGELESILEWVNDPQNFNGNIEMSDLKDIDASTFMFSLRTIDIDGPGHRVTLPAVYGGRPARLSTACWHVQKVFYDDLSDWCNVLVSGGKVTLIRGLQPDFPEWDIKGYNIRKLCDCEESRGSFNPRPRVQREKNNPYRFAVMKGLKGR